MGARQLLSGWQEHADGSEFVVPAKGCCVGCLQGCCGVCCCFAMTKFQPYLDEDETLHRLALSSLLITHYHMVQHLIITHLEQHRTILSKTWLSSIYLFIYLYLLPMVNLCLCTYQSSSHYYIYFPHKCTHCIIRGSKHAPKPGLVSSMFPIIFYVCLPLLPSCVLRSRTERALR